MAFNNQVMNDNVALRMGMVETGTIDGGARSRTCL